MKKIKLIVSTLVSIIAFATFVFAGTGVIQFGDPTVTRDKTFNLTVKVKSTDVRLKSASITIDYNPNMIEFISGTNSEGGAGTVKISGTGEGKSSGTRTLEYQLKFKALYAGIANVTISDQEVTDNTDNLVNITKLGTSKITIKPSNTQSKNSNLATLEFSPGELDRNFEASILDYNTEVNADVESLAINAIPEDKDAKVTIEGNENFATGMNKVTIQVTAPDGKTTKAYVLNVTKLETGVTSGDTTITNGQRLSSNKYTITVMIKPEDIAIPSGYKKLDAEFGGSTIEAYGPINTPSMETPDSFLIYAMNSNGIIDFYRYDTKNGDNTIQRYIPEPNAGNYEEANAKYESVRTQYNDLAKKFNVILPVAIGLLCLVVILIIVLIVVIVKNGSNNVKKNPYAIDDYDDDDDDYFLNNKKSKPIQIRSSSNIDEDKEENGDDINDAKDDEELDDIEDLG